LHAPLHISTLQILHTQQTGRHENDFAARGYICAAAIERARVHRHLPREGQRPTELAAGRAPGCRGAPAPPVWDKAVLPRVLLG
jgi:hypothetical protein